jgi:hypothetical protein
MKQIETQGLDRFAGALLIQNREVVENYLRILGNKLGRGFGRGGRSSATPNERPLIPQGSKELAPPYFLLLRAKRPVQEKRSQTSHRGVPDH